MINPLDPSGGHPHAPVINLNVAGKPTVTVDTSKATPPGVPQEVVENLIRAMDAETEALQAALSDALDRAALESHRGDRLQKAFLKSTRDAVTAARRAVSKYLPEAAELPVPALPDLTTAPPYPSGTGTYAWPPPTMVTPPTPMPPDVPLGGSARFTPTTPTTGAPPMPPFVTTSVPVGTESPPDAIDLTGGTDPFARLVSTLSAGDTDPNF